MFTLEYIKGLALRAIICGAIAAALFVLFSHMEVFAGEKLRITDKKGFTKGYIEETRSGTRYSIKDKEGFTKGYIEKSYDDDFYSSYEREKPSGYHTKWMNENDKD